jgi:TetR/AcrR family transcriptional regulator
MGTQTRKQLEKENRRELILKAAEKVMQAKGLHGLNLDLIASETQLAKGTIYLYFKSKEEILSFLTIKARILLYNDFQKINVKNISSIEKLKAIVKCNYLFYKKNSLYYDLFSFYEANERLIETEEMYKSSERIANLVESIALQAKEEGSLNPNINPKSLTWTLYGSTVGMMQIMKVRGTLIKTKLNISEDALLKTFIELMENGIKK